MRGCRDRRSICINLKWCLVHIQIRVQLNVYHLYWVFVWFHTMTCIWGYPLQLVDLNKLFFAILKIIFGLGCRDGRKFLSTAGRDVLIKMVAQAIPAYVMQCFRLPASLCAEFQSMICPFWWNQKGNERKLHLWSWQQLCRPKMERGLGFRDFECFNQPLLAKKGWCLLQFPDSLLSRLLKAKYYYNFSFLDASVGFSPSYTWRSILSGRDVLLRGYTVENR